MNKKSAKKAIDHIYPLTPLQEGLLFQSLYAPESDAYFVQSVMEIKGTLHVESMKNAWLSLINHHPILRTGVLWEGLDTPLQYVLNTVAVPWEVLDWSQEEKKDRHHKLKAFIEADRRKSFDLSKAPLFRITLIKHSAHEHTLIWSHHHILTDGWSGSILKADLFKAYEAIRSNQEVSLAPRRPYRDYIAWLQRQDKTTAESFWKETLKDLAEPTRLSFKNMLPPPKEADYATYSFKLSEAETKELQQFAKTHALTMNTLLQGAVGKVLHTYTQKSDLVIGVTVSGRSIDLAEIEEMVGIFINTLPLRIVISPEDTPLSFLRSLQEKTQDLNHYAYTPLAQIQSWVSNAEQLFDVLFVFENYPEHLDGNKKELKVTSAPGNEKTEYPLTIGVGLETELHISLSYQTEHFDESIIKRLASHLRTSLKGILSLKDTPLDQLCLLTPSEQHQLLIEWNDTKTEYPEDKTIHQLFEEQVEKTPNNIAVVYEDQTLTYQQLNERANQLAHYLRELGVKPDSLVAIAVERSLEMIVGLLGILKAGAAYVPLDPSYPQERLQFMLDDTNASVLITQTHLQNNLQEILTSYRGKIILLEPEDNNFHQYNMHNASSFYLPHHLSYIIYTSGSTGKPKGVAINHKGVSHRLLDLRGKYQLSHQDSFLQYTSFNFDASLEEIFLPLISGAKFFIFPPHNKISFEEIAPFIHKNGITVFNGVPSLLLSLFSQSHDDPSLKLQIQTLILGGEALPQKLLQFCNDISVVWNTYGPTEAIIDSTIFQCRKLEGLSQLETIPIGKPLSNTQIYILDHEMNPVPINVPGEIYIGGEGLARGYWNRPDLTAERFVPNPFVSEKDQKEGKNLRLYRTGDLARYLSDGNIEFLGRIDDQVKIRGFRIECKEIEFLLNTHGDVSAAVVLAREEDTTNKKLVAYIVLKKTKGLSKDTTYISASKKDFSTLKSRSLPIIIESLKNHLSKSLPDYMIPSFFVMIDKIPLTSNGKLDKKALPAPDLSVRLLSESYVAPRTPIESDLATVWSEVLRIPQVGIHDNFFRIGGDSIVSIQLMAKARKNNLFFTIRDVFQYPTIAELARVTTGAAENVIKLDQGFLTGPLPLLPIQHWFFEQNFPHKNHFNQDILLKLHPSLNCSLLKGALLKLLSHHDLLRASYKKEGASYSQAYGGVVPPLEDFFIEEDLSPFLGNDSKNIYPLDYKKTQEKLIHERASTIQQSLNIENGVLVKVALFSFGPQEPPRLLIVIHHLVVDGVSWRILLDDLQTLLSGQGLPSKTHSYRDWGKALLSYASSENLLKELPYWQEVEDQLVPLFTDRNTDRAQETATSKDVSTIQVSLSQQDTTRLLKEIHHAYRTEINDILLTALVLAMGDWKGSYDLTLFLEGHGREDIIPGIDLSRTVGWFTSIFPVTLKLETNDLGESIKTVKEQLRCIPHKGIGYGILKYLHKNISLSSSKTKPISSGTVSPTLSFNYLGQWDNTTESNALLTFASESSGSSVSSLNQTGTILNLNGDVKDGIFRMNWSYRPDHYCEETIQALSQSFINRLKEIVDYCTHKENFGYTTSDFSLIHISQSRLNQTFGAMKDIDHIYPLTPLQEGLLFQSLYAPESDAYFVQSVMEIKGTLHVESMKNAWLSLINHHPILRTGVLWEGLDTPLQYVLNTVAVPWEVLDWSQEEKKDRHHKLKAFIEADRRKSFDLSKAPLFRITLIKHSAHEHTLIWSHHHILTDGWSGSILKADLFKAYEAIRSNQEVSLAPRRPYRDYIAWLQRQDKTTAESFWKETLKDLAEPTRLSFKNMLPPPKEADYATYSFKLSEAETKELQQFAKTHALTMNTLLQGAVGKVLHTYTQKSDLVIGVTVSGRSIDLAEIEEMVGIFINTLPLRIVISPEDTPLSFLRSLQEKTQDLNHYAYTPLAQIQSWVSNAEQLFDVLFVFENYPEHLDGNKKELKVTSAPGNEKTEYPLTIGVGLETELHISLSYQTEHFDESIIKRLASHLRTSLKGILSLKDTPLDQLCLLTPSEQHQLLIEWNDTKTEYPEDKTIHQLFEEQVEKTPNNIAVVYEDQTLTYQQLNERANQLAHYLRELGVKPDSLVAIAVERSLEMIVGLLGILKAGAAYVPLDPSYPQERLQFMLDDTNASVLITQTHLHEAFRNYSGTILNLRVSTETQELFVEEYFLNTKDSQTQRWISFPIESSQNPRSLTTSHNLAYVIYTSGSTGKPKGVMIGHSNFIPYVNYAKRAYPLCNGSSLFHSSPAFDMSITSLFLPLIEGSSIHILPTDSDISALADIFSAQNNVGFIELTPTHLRALKNQLIPNFIYKQRGTFIIGGENLLKDDAEFCLEMIPEASFFNEYGPTETTVGCCAFELKDSCTLFSDSVPIGRPIANAQIYILDTQLNPVPIGVRGEIYIGGAGLARGYLDYPYLTAERFIPNLFIKATSQEKTHPAEAKNLRLYRTGDLARYLPDGNIEFLGRMDDQVKIRGFRIELGEIELVLKTHNDITEVVVIAQEDEPGNKRIIAYVVLTEEISNSLAIDLKLSTFAGDSFSLFKGEQLPSITENLKNHLAQSLPDYMIPSFFVYINKVPLTLSGKTDRKALPTPDLTFRQVGGEYVAPLTSLDQELCNIWSEVLKIDKIGIHDNFFKLGGHSLLAMQVISRIRHIYNINIPLRALFEHATIDALNTIVGSLIRENQLSSIPPLLPQERQGSIPLSFSQARLWFLDQLLPGMAIYNIPVALRVRGTLNIDVLEKAFNSLIERHEALRTVFLSTRKGEVFQEILPHWEFPLSEHSVDLTLFKKEDQESSAQNLAQQEAITPFDLSAGPLIRIKVLILGKEEHILLITLHHIISDGWSMEILFRELSSLYNSYEEDKEPSLSPLPIQYADFALWQRKWLQGDVLEQQLSYWKNQLAGIPDLLELPTDKPRPKELTYKGAAYDLTLSREIKDQLNRLAQQHQASLFMTLLAIFQVLLYRYTGQKDVVVGTPMANRHDKEIEGLIGFFVNTVALRTTFEGNETFVDILNKVKETTLQAYQHQDVPFEQLVDHLNVTREFNRNPVFQIMFALQNSLQEAPLNIGKTQGEPFYRSYPIAQFDLSLSIQEKEETLELSIEYATDLFEAETIQRMGDHFKELIEGIIKTPTQDVQTLSLLTKSERHQLLIEWNDTKTDYAKEKTLHQLFEEQVEKTPNNIAVVYEDQELTYQELNKSANQLAYYLRTLGVKPETLVATAVERSLEMIIGLLGILKAGGTYIPLDPTYPQERLQFMLEDTNAPILITQTHLNETFKAYPGTTLNLCWENETRELFIEKRSFNTEHSEAQWFSLKTQSSENPQSLVTSQHLVYVIYTSGSTGKPKGVENTHHALTNRIEWTLTHYQISEKDSLLYIASVGFDISVWEMIFPLVAGASLVIASDNQNKDVHSIAELIKTHGITVLHFVPSLLDLFIRLQEAQKCHFIKKIITGGEALSNELRQEFINTFKYTDLFLAYGPTEAAISVTHWNCRTNKYQNKTPIGRPISNTHIYLLDSQLNPVPVGVSGEIYIGGVSLARGYLNRPDLTAEKFVPNPFINQEMDQDSQTLRLYRTGDLARYLPDGNIEFLGRIDDQVKIRGFRIELAEIEVALQSHGNVAQAVVVAREDEPGSKKLVAYIVKEKEYDNLSTKPRLWPSIAEYFVYDDFVYDILTNDDLRNHYYKLAIQKLAKNKVVLDVGTGRDAILARFCNEAGALKVYAIEYLESSYHQARKTLQILNLENKIILIHGDATKVTLPEKVDLIVSEIVGPIGSLEGAIGILNDARKRHLKNKGHMIPCTSNTHIAAVKFPESLFNNPFEEIPDSYAEKIFGQVGYHFDLRVGIENFPLDHVISTAGLFENLDFNSFISENYTEEVTLNILEDDNINGFLLWLNLETIENIFINTLEQKYCWIPIYFPVFEESIPVSKGDYIAIKCTRTLSENNLNPDYYIEGDIIKITGENLHFEYASKHYTKNYRSNTFYKHLFEKKGELAREHTPNVLQDDLRNHLARTLPNYMIPTFFVYINQIPLTSNGKIDRKALPAPDLSLRLVGDAYVAPQTSLEQDLCTIWKDVLKVEKIGIHDSFFRIGGDSIISIQMVSKARARGIHFAVRDVYSHPTIAALASIAQAQEVAVSLKPAQESTAGEVPLTPIQHWYFKSNLSEPNHFNQATLLFPHTYLNLDLINQAFSHLLTHHDALRFRYAYHNNQWTQICLNKQEDPICKGINLSALSDDELPIYIEKETSLAHQSLDIQKGPIIKALLLNYGKNQRLLIIIHHLVIDGISWRILIEDLERVYSQLVKGESPSLPPKTHSYQQWSQALTDYASSEALKEIPYWQQIESSVRSLPLDFNHGPAKEAVAATIAVSLSEQETQDLLQQAPKAYHTQINDILLTALVLAIGDWTQEYCISLALEGHGREEIVKGIDLSRTIGWFTSIFPIHLKIDNPHDLGETIKTVKEILRKIPNKGIGYGILSHLTKHSPLSCGPRPSLSFNYLGQGDHASSQKGLFSFAQESMGHGISSENDLAYLLNINSEVSGGTLTFLFTYSQNHYKDQTINQLSHTFIERLKQLIRHCCIKSNFGYTPSDFPLASLTQEELDLRFTIPHVEHIYPLSPMQSGLLFQALYAPESDAYFVQSVFDLHGEVDSSTLKEAWQKLSDHRPILRTGFVWENFNKPLQYVLEAAEVPFSIEDWRYLSKKEREEKLEVFIQEDRKKGFDLKKPPLFRLTLIQYAPRNYYLIWSQHHILLDGWCLPIILDDVFKAYQALRQNREIHLTLPRPYRDYIAWLQDQDLNKAEAFWKNYLSALEGPTQLSFKGIIEKNKEKDYDAYAIELSLEETESIKKFAANHQVTLNTILQGAVGSVLRTYTQQQEVILGVTVSGRSIPLTGIENMVGIFINTLPLRIAFKQGEDSLSFFKSLQEQTQMLNEYAYISLAQIQSWAHKNGKLFDVIFVFENYPPGESTHRTKLDFSIKGLKGVEKTEYPLTIIVGPGERIHLSLEYQTEHFDEAFIKRFATHIRQVLKTFGGEIFLHRSMSDVSPVTQQERDQMLIEWNDTKQVYPEDKTIHQLFEEQVERTSNNIAVVFEGQELTYQKLNERSNRLAHYLRYLGVGPDTLVAIAVERSLEMIIGLLGILKAGGAYVPLDPNYPQERLQFMLEDTKAPILLIQSSLKPIFKNYPGILFALDEDWETLHQYPSTNPLPLTSSCHLAYVIYTSGSTGKPKGVMVGHKGLHNRLLWMQNKYELTFTDRVLQKTPFTFDVSCWELFWPLLTGSTEVIANLEIHKDPNALSRFMKQQSISICHFVPSMLDSFLTAEKFHDPSFLRLLVTSGESLSRELVKKCHSKLNTQLENLYGPTESSIDVTYYPCSRNDDGIVSVPIGHPISNTQVYVLDEQMNPVPVGVGGEIYIGGAGLARGYLNRPDLTADRFIPNPFVNPEGDQGGSNLRLYRTGDLARYLPDGNIEFLGRIDDQVKIRGFRIELGEIESILQSHGDIVQAVVMAREDEPNHKHLVAYVMLPEEKAVSLTIESVLTSSSGDSFAILYGEDLPALTEDLRNHLARSLPDYMIPSFFLYIDKIPLTSNGKIDRKSLPAPNLSLRLVSDAYVAPRTLIEQDLCNIWKEVLKVEQIGIHDNFFRIGGDSIISIQMVSKARTCGIHFAVRDVFNHPTIMALACIAKTQEANLSFKPDQGSVAGEIPLTPIQHEFFKSNLEDRNYFNQATLLQSSRKLDPSFLNQAFSLLLSHHDVLRLRYSQDHEGHWIQTSLAELETFLVQEIDLSHILSEAHLAQSIEERASFIQQTLNIEKGALIQVALFNCGEARQQRLLIAIHHLVVDGVSWRILLEDLERLYNQLIQGQTPSLASKTHSYQQWGQSLKEYASSQSLKKEIPYWQKILDVMQPLPIDFNQGPATGESTRTIALSLAEEETSLLLQRVPKAYRTEINDILLTALVLAIGDWTQNYSLALSLEGHGREDIIKDIDLSRTMGWFTSIFPVHLSIENPHDLEEAIKTVKETLRKIPYKGIGYGILSYLTPEPSLSASAHPSLNFNYLGQWDNTLEHGGLFTFSQDSAGRSVSDKNEQSHLLNINIEVRQGVLHLFWSYSSHHYYSQTIEKIAHAFIERIKQLIQHCCQGNTFGYTPSDFKLANLDLNKLNKRIKMIESL